MAVTLTDPIAHIRCGTPRDRYRVPYRRPTAAGALRHAAAAAASAVLLALAGCEGEFASTARSVAHTAASASVLVPDIEAAERDARHRNFAVRALLLNLLDDSDLPRFNALDHPLLCSEGTTVRVNGAPLQPGAEVPTGSFTLDWQLGDACPLGIGGPVLSGPLQMIVVRDDDLGLVPVVLEPH